MSLNFYDRAGGPLTIEQWAMLQEDDEYRQLGLTEVGEARVSTIWIGFDLTVHIFPDFTPKLVQMFETMIFGGPYHLSQWRYFTEEQAIEGHALAVLVAQGGDEN